MKFKDEKKFDDVHHPMGKKYPKEREPRKKKPTDCPDEDHHHHDHHHHPNEKSCDCHKHHDRHCHHGFEKPFHDHHCDCDRHHHHDCDHRRCDCDCHHHHDCDRRHCDCHHKHHHNHCGCGHHHRHHPDCHHRHDHCRRLLCDDDFRLRLGGLQNNLNFKLRQLIGCLVDLELEDGRKMEAQICYVGTNFVEIKKFDDIMDPVLDPDQNEEPESLDHEQPEDIELADESSEPKRHCSSWIIPVEKIKYVKIHHEEKCC